MRLEELATLTVLGSLLDRLQGLGGYEVLDHWQQGEFHHDLLLRLPQRGALAGSVLVVATNCNGGVKEVLCFDRLPERAALWHARCPDNPEFAGELPPLLDRYQTLHWFDPCELLLPDALSEYRPEFRERQPGGGWRFNPEGRGSCH